jgi:glycosyltransferase involved in cell wall biosynthesis
MPLRVVRLTRGFHPRTDGWSRHALRLSQEQARAGHEVVVFQPEMPSATIGGVRVHRLGGGYVNQRGASGVLAFSVLAIPALTAEQLKARPDLIHVHGDALEIGGALLAATFFRRPVVATIHATLSSRRSMRELLARAAPYVSGFIVVSPVIRDELKALGVPEARMLVQNSGVDLADFAASETVRPAMRRELGVGPNEFLALYLGRLEPAKGLETLADARSVLSKDIVIVVAGAGSLGPRLRSRVSEGLRLIGPVAHERVAALLAAADAFVLPSVDLPGTSEGTPTAILEAFAARVPVVATNAGGIPAVIEHERTGLLVGQRDARAIASGITRLRDDRRLRDRVTEEGYTLASSNDWPAVAARMTDFARRVIASHVA